MSYVVYLIAYVASFAAFAFNSIFWLRVLTIVSSTFFVIYYFFFQIEPLWMDVVSEGAMVLMNVGMLILFWIRQKRNVLSKEEKEIYEAFFSNFSLFEFFKLVRIGKWLNFSSEHELIKKGDKLHLLYFIYDGSLEVHTEEGLVTLNNGHFVGERSFNTKDLANATVNVQKSCRLLVWEQDELRSLLKRSPSMQQEFNAALHKDLANKLYS